MILVQFHWVLALVVIGLSVGFLLFLRGLKKYYVTREVDANTAWTRDRHNQKSRYDEALEDLKKHSQGIIDEQGSRYESNLEVRNGMIRGSVPAMIHVTQMHEGTDAADGACRWLYAANCLGIWTSNKKTSRALARGQSLCSANPMEFDRIMKQVLIDNEMHDSSRQGRKE